MKPGVSVTVLLAAIFLGGSLLAPWVYGAMQALAQALPLLEGLADEPFRRYVTRSWMIIGIAGLWPFLKGVGARSRDDVGLGRSPDMGRHLLVGLAIGFGSLAIVAALVLLVGAREIDVSRAPGTYIKHLSSAVLAAIAVSFIEELFFRGAIFGGLRTARRLGTAVILSSALYATLHFFERSVWEGPVDWVSGLVLLPRMLRGLTDVRQLVPGLLSLTLAGCVLAIAYQKTGSLYLSIGVHAGWIFWMKSYGFFTREVPGANVWFWGTRKLIDGWLAFLLLAAMVWAFTRWYERESLE